MIGKMLKIIRTEKGYNQKELSNLMNIAQTTLSGYETKYSNPTFDTIEKLVNLCDYEIIFRNKLTQNEYKLEDIERKDIY